MITLYSPLEYTQSTTQYTLFTTQYTLLTTLYTLYLLCQYIYLCDLLLENLVWLVGQQGFNQEAERNKGKKNNKASGFPTTNHTTWTLHLEQGEQFPKYQTHYICFANKHNPSR